MGDLITAGNGNRIEPRFDDVLADWRRKDRTNGRGQPVCGHFFGLRGDRHQRACDRPGDQERKHKGDDRRDDEQCNVGVAAGASRVDQGVPAFEQ